MKILTQEKFDEILENDDTYNRHVAVIKDYIVKDIVINAIHFVKGNKIFIDDCKIESIVIEWPISYLMIKCVTFVNCEIVDYEKISGIDFSCFENCTFLKPVPFACPEEGEFIGYKKCVYHSRISCIIKLLVPADAKRSSGFSNKCRCSKAEVLDIYDLNGNELDLDKAYSIGMSVPSITYEVGKEVYPDDFDENRYEECSNGIHFFMTFDEAKYYVY